MYVLLDTNSKVVNIVDTTGELIATQYIRVDNPPVGLSIGWTFSSGVFSPPDLVSLKTQAKNMLTSTFAQVVIDHPMIPQDALNAALAQIDAAGTEAAVNAIKLAVGVQPADLYEKLIDGSQTTETWRLPATSAAPVLTALQNKFPTISFTEAFALSRIRASGAEDKVVVYYVASFLTAASYLKYAKKQLPLRCDSFAVTFGMTSGSIDVETISNFVGQLPAGARHARIGLSSNQSTMYLNFGSDAEYLAFMGVSYVAPSTNSMGLGAVGIIYDTTLTVSQMKRYFF